MRQSIHKSPNQNAESAMIRNLVHQRANDDSLQLRWRKSLGMIGTPVQPIARQRCKISDIQNETPKILIERKKKSANETEV